MRDHLVQVFMRPAALLLAALFLTACGQDAKPRVIGFTGQTMGTSFTLKWVVQDISQVDDIRQEAEQLLAQINQSMSTYISDSELSLLNSSQDSSAVPVSNELFEVLSLAQAVSHNTQGAFDITVGPLVNLWGFGPDGRVIKAPDPQQISLLKNTVGYQRIQLNSDLQQLSKPAGMYMDLSAVAKGYAVDKLAGLLVARGIENYLAEIGGELRAAGLKPDGVSWRIAVESPISGKRSIQRIIEVVDIGIATSGDYRNYFEQDGVRFSHTIDPANGRPISHKLASVTVLRPTCAEADALATAFMVMGEDEAYRYALDNDISAMFIVKNGDGFIEKTSPGFTQYIVE
ncbi:MAG: FAD:protein FMN transferase [Amphritea sp.]